MRSGGSILWKITGLLGVTLASAWIALRMFDYWSSPTTAAWPVPPAPSMVHIVDATYGLSCQSFAVAPGLVNSVKPGNATAAVARICENAMDDCNFVADTRDLGDPAPGCAKDLSITWRCSLDDKTHKLQVAGEAHSKPVALSCPLP
jgi:hypothetical protein